MKLLTNKIIEQATKQYEKNSDMEQMVVAKFFNPVGSWTWYLMNMADNKDYCWGIVNGHALEMGSFSIKELEDLQLPLGMKIERDLYFEPMKASKVWEQLENGEHV
tara:strand:+ start:35 stop:352 length:318 start_codon:yes stop_codon:yes gene_type:complete